MDKRTETYGNEDRGSEAGRRSRSEFVYPDHPDLAAAVGPQRRQQPSVEELLQVFESHIAVEADSLGEYQRLSSATDDPVIRLLMKLILEDEERHHGLLSRMAATMRDDLDWTHSTEALATGTRRLDPKVATQLLGIVQQGIREERRGASFFRELAKEQPDLYHGVFALLLEMMAMDSKKHEAILRLVERRLKEGGS